MTTAQAAQLIQDVQEILWFLGVAVCVVSGVNPRDWTGSGEHLGGLSGVLVFELLRALVTECGV